MPARTTTATTTPDGAASSIDRDTSRGKVLRLMVKEGMWLFAAIAVFGVTVAFNVNSPPRASGGVFVTAAAVQLCSWLGTAAYFRASGTRQQPVTRQQWRLLVTSTVCFSLVLIVIQSGSYFRAGYSRELMFALGPAIVMAISSKFFGKTWSTTRKLAVAPIVVGMALASFYFLGVSVTGFTASLLHGVCLATLLVIQGELFTGEMQMSSVQLLSRTAPLTLLQAVVLAFSFGEVTRVIENSAYLGSILYSLAALAPLSALVALCSLQAVKVTSPLTFSITIAVYRIMADGLARSRYNQHVRVNFLGFIVMACLRYTVLRFIERTRASSSSSQAPDDDPSPPREQPEGTVVVEEEEEEGNVMLRPLLRAEAQSAARQQQDRAAAGPGAV